MTPELIGVTLVVGAGTYLIRASFLSVAHKAVVLPAWVEAALGHIPAAALAALVAQGVLRPGGELDPWSYRLAGAAVAIVVARLWPSNLAVPLLAGIGVATVLVNFA